MSNPIVQGQKGVFITKSGFNVLTETNPSNFAYNSNWGAYKFAYIQTVTVAVTDDKGSNPSLTTSIFNITLPTNITFSPFNYTRIFFADHGTTGSSVRSAIDSFNDFGATQPNYQMYVSTPQTAGSININFGYNSGGTTLTHVTYYIYLFGNPL